MLCVVRYLHIHVCISALDKEGWLAGGAGGGLHGAGHIGGGHIGECCLGGGYLQQAGQEGRQDEVKTHLGVRWEELKVWKL